MKKINKNFSNNERDNTTPSSNSILTEPEDSFEVVNKYGTYEIQPTCATENTFPKIAQGLPKKKDRKTDNFTQK